MNQPLQTTPVNQAVVRVIDAFKRMRVTCPHYTGKQNDWEASQCVRSGNNHAGSTCGMGYCPELREQADEAEVGWY